MQRPATISPLTIVRGDDKTYTCTVKDADGTAVPLTGATVDFTVRRDYDSPPAVIHKDSGEITEIEITDPTNGIFKLYLVPADTQYLSGRFYYDFQITFASGKKGTPQVGEFIVNKDVTH